jgi:hypothetical protein
MSDDYTSARAKIEKAATLDDLRKLDKSYANCWNNGIFTLTQYTKLDCFILDRMIALEEGGA